MNNTMLTTYGEMYEVGNQFNAYYHNGRNLVQILETRMSKTGRVAAKFENCATGQVFWHTAKDPKTACAECPIGAGDVTLDWDYEGKR